MNIPNQKLPIPLPDGLRWAAFENRYLFPIDDAYGWLDDFARNLLSVDIDFYIDVEDDFPPAYAITSPHLADLPPNEAYARALSLTTLLNGALRLTHGLDFHGFHLSRCFDIQRKANVNVSRPDLPFMEPYPNDHEKIVYQNGPQLGLSATGRILFFARYDMYVQFMLNVLGAEGITLVSLYKLIDTMRYAGWNEPDLAALIGKKQSDIKDFTFTANNHQASGIQSRHGYKADQIDTKKTALTLRQSDALIRPMASAFIAKRMDGTFERLWERVQF
jgi:hypothetical protein